MKASIQDAVKSPKQAETDGTDFLAKTKEGDISNNIPSAFSTPSPYIIDNTTGDILIREIDDNLISGFNRDTFSHIRFTTWKKVKLLFEDTFPFITQSIFVPIFAVLFKSFFKVSINGKENLRGLTGPMLFVSNHISFYDSFMFDLLVKPFSHILPFRFMGTRKFIVPFLMILKMIGIVDIIYFLFGVFRITPGEGAEKSLKKAYEIIKQGGTVVMYPEGRIWKPTNVHPDRIGPFKWGAAILAKNTGVKIIPVSFKKFRDENGKRNISINIGQKFFVDDSLKAEDIASNMRERVKGLYDAM